MMQDKVNTIVKGIFGGAGVLVFVVALLAIAPFLLIWGINTLSALGGAGVYIPHGFYSYLAAFAVVFVLRGG